jgi:hypothetical protein
MPGAAPTDWDWFNQTNDARRRRIAWFNQWNQGLRHGLDGLNQSDPALRHRLDRLNQSGAPIRPTPDRKTKPPEAIDILRRKIVARGRGSGESLSL